MARPKCDELDYIHFLIAAQKVFSNTEAARKLEPYYREMYRRCGAWDVGMNRWVASKTSE